MNNVIETFVGI